MKLVYRIQLILLGFSLFIGSDLMAQAQNRLDDPLVIQLNAFGGFAAGYHIGKSYYIGVMQTTALNTYGSEGA